jgi:hypothetical protein
VAAAFALAFDRLPARLGREAAVIAGVVAAVAAPFCALVLPTPRVTPPSLEDPLVWTLLALAATLRARHGADRPLPSRSGRAGSYP